MLHLMSFLGRLASRLGFLFSIQLHDRLGRLDQRHRLGLYHQRFLLWSVLSWLIDRDARGKHRRSGKVIQVAACPAGSLVLDLRLGFA